jgi:cytochrome b561
MTNTSHQSTRFIHWLSASLIIGLLASGIYMADGNDYALYDWHKAFGVLALFLVIIRLYYRKKNPWPSSANGTKHEKLVHFMHQFLLFVCVMMPISGIAYSGLGGHGVDVFGFNLIPNGYNQQGEAVPYSAVGSDLGKSVHYYLGYLMTTLVLLHVLAAFKHHFVDKDSTLRNMLSNQIGSLPKTQTQDK